MLVTSCFVASCFVASRFVGSKTLFLGSVFVKKILFSHLGVTDEQYAKMTESAFTKAQEISTSRILNYLYVLLSKYSALNV
jgi:hypothetical protein